MAFVRTLIIAIEKNSSENHGRQDYKKSSRNAVLFELIVN